MVDTSGYLLVSAALFAAGVGAAVARRSFASLVVGLGLGVDAALLAFAAGSRTHGAVEGQIWALVALVAGAAQLVAGLALGVALFRQRQSDDVDALDELRW